MTKIVYNACYGGFSLSDAAVLRYAEIKGVTLYPEEEPRSGGLVTHWTVPKGEREKHMLQGKAWDASTMEQRIASNAYYSDHVIYSLDLKRDDPVLVQVVEEMGEAANGMCAKLRIAELPTGTAYRISGYDGFEGIETNDSIDWSVA